MKITSDTDPADAVVFTENEHKDTKEATNHPDESSPSDDVASKLSDLSESSTDVGHEHDGILSPTDEKKNSRPANQRQLRSERSEDYENFEKMLRNKHSKACKAMSVRCFGWMLVMAPLVVLLKSDTKSV
jgi:hypothetical protein